MRIFCPKTMLKVVRIIIIYNFFTGNMKFYLTKCFQDKIGRGNPWLSKIFNFPKKSIVLRNFIVFWDENVRIFSQTSQNLTSLYLMN